MKNLGCRWLKTNDPKEIAKEVRKEVKRQQSRLDYKSNKPKKKDDVKQRYHRNLNKERERKRVGEKEKYDRDPQKQRDRKRVDSKKEYDRDPQKQRDRKRVDSKKEYDRNTQKQRDRKKVAEKEKYDRDPQVKIDVEKERYDRDPQKKIDADKERNDRNPQKKRDNEKQRFEARKASQDTVGDLQKFLDNGRYGPIFSCVCCHELKWRSGVRHTQYPSVSLSGKIDMEYVTVKHKELFLKVGKYYICDACHGSHQPKLRATNILTCPWENVPQRLLPKNPVRSPCEHLKGLKVSFAG